jgi:lipopolysaccharide export system permease protein
LIKQITLYGIPFNVALMIVLLNLPQVIVMAIPMSVLFSTVMTLNRLSLSSEITVMRACGIGLNRIAKPIFIFSVVMSLFTFIMNETVVPITNSQSKTLAVWALGQKNIPNGKQNFTFKEISKNQEGNTYIKRLFFVQKCEDNTLKNVTVVDFSEKDTLKVIQSQRGKTSPEGWQFIKGAAYTMTKKENILNSVWFARTTADFGMDVKDKLTEDEATQYNVIALWKYIEKNSKKHKDLKLQSLFKIELHNKFAFPFTTMVLVLLGVPLAITPPRVRYNRGFLFSILIIFLYYLLRALSLSLGEEMKIIPLLAAWIPNIILFVLGSILYYKKVYTIN